MIKMEISQKKRKRKHKLGESIETTQMISRKKVTATENRRAQQNNKGQHKKIDSYSKSNKTNVKGSSPAENKGKSKQWKKAMNRPKTKWVVYSKNPTNSSNGAEESHQENQSKQNSKTSKRNSNTELKKHKKKVKDKKENSPAETKIKVQTHAALYRNPQDFSSNWKKLQQEISDGKKRPLKRKADQQKPSQPAKKRKKNGNPQPNKSVITKSSTMKKPEIWFDDVDEDLLDLEVRTPIQGKPATGASKKTETTGESKKETSKTEETANLLVKERSFEGLTKAVAMDCEMVGVGSGGEDSVLARVSLVNQFGKCIYDKYVKPREHVTDYRTEFSGIRPADLKNAEDFSIVQKDVYDIMKGRILVGHALQNDLKVLYLDHPRKKVRDTSRYRGFRKLFQGKTPSLKKLTGKVLGVNVQEGEHNSVEDAQAAMRLYTMYKVQWEKELKLKYNKKLLKPVIVTETDS